MYADYTNTKQPEAIQELGRQYYYYDYDFINNDYNDYHNEDEL
jgi:hypothetical protein